MRDIGNLCKLRDDACDWITYGRWAAIAVAIFGCLFAIVEREHSVPAVALARLALYLSVGVAGMLLQPTRVWASFLLLTLLALTFLLSALLSTLFSGIPFRLAVVGVCVKGALSVFRYRNIERLILAPATDETKEKIAEQPQHGADPNPPFSSP